MNIVIIGYPYTRPNYRATFEALNVYFILPKIWKIKNGKAEYRVEKNSHIMTTFAPFYHSDYPIIGGLLKGWMPMFPWLLWKMKRRYHVRLVFEAHEPTLLTTLYHGITAKMLGLKHIVFSWENIPFERKFFGIRGILHRLILSANLALADGVVCGNQRCLDIFRAITTKPLAHIPLAGLDPEKFKPSLSRPAYDTITFVFAGAVDYRKGLHILLPAFKKLVVEVPQARLVLIGSGAYEEQLQAQIANLNLPVTRFPWIDHIKLVEILSRSDIFVYPSISYGGWEEQFGYSMAEASLMELPVIATRTGSIEEVVIDGTTGLLVPGGDEKALMDAMFLLACDAAKRKAMGNAGREFIKRYYDNSVVSRKYGDFFQLFNK